jgi:AraC family transcriptional regulator
MPENSIVQTERDWQNPSRTRVGSTPLPRVVLARWSGGADDGRSEVVTDHADLSHFITYSMIKADVDFTIGRKAITRGVVMPHRVLLQGPTAEKRWSVYSGRFEFFRIYLSQEILKECLDDYAGRDMAGDIRLFDTHFIKDAAIKHMTESLLQVDDTGGALGQSYVDAVGLSLAWNLIGRHSEHKSRSRKLPSSPLSPLRLKRVIEYIDAYIGTNLSLAELSSIAGLTRIHFSAQFRAAMNSAPYAYILARRVEFAKILLSRKDRQITEIALELGFSNQAHFTDAFKRMTGDPPARWRMRAHGIN